MQTNQIVEALPLADGNKFNIVYDEYPQNPRDDDNLCIFYCFHRRYTLGDRHWVKHEDFNGWDAMKAGLRKLHKGKGTIILPLYMYDHSGITISTMPFGCPWDSGQIGFVVFPHTALREIGPGTTPQEVIQAEVEEYDMYLRGECYAWEIRNPEDEVIDNCCGYLGDAGLERIRDEYKHMLSLTE